MINLKNPHILHLKASSASIRPDNSVLLLRIHVTGLYVDAETKVQP